MSAQLPAVSENAGDGSDEPLPPSFDETILEVSGRQVHLLAAWCDSCGQWSFPATPACPRCGGSAQRRRLAESGTLWSHAVLRAAVTIHPTPATIAQVDFAGTRVGGLLRSGQPTIGAKCRLVPLELEYDGSAVTAYCFEIEEALADA